LAPRRFPSIPPRDLHRAWHHPTAATRQGDFSQTEFPTLYDWASCIPATGACVPFPANIIPASRLDPGQVMAANLLPPPNSPPPSAASSIGLFQSSGSAVPGSTFTIDGQIHRQHLFLRGLWRVVGTSLRAICNPRFHAGVVCRRPVDRVDHRHVPVIASLRVLRSVCRIIV